MDRWVFESGSKSALSESTLASFSNCRLYDGDTKTDFKDGLVTVTTHAIKFKNDVSSLFIPLRLVVLTSSVPGSWKHSPKVEISLQSWERSQKPPGPVSKSTSNSIKISVSKKGDEEFCVRSIMDALKRRVWENTPPELSPAVNRILAPASSSRMRGIGAAVRGQEQKHERETNLTSAGLQDLNNLMAHAKEMAQLARATSQRLDQKTDDNTQMDDVARLRGIMMNLGIDNDIADQRLESEISMVARPLIARNRGMVLLEEIYCALNRARGTALVSPDEILHAAKNIEKIYPQAGLKYKKYKSGIAVLQDNTLSDNAIVDQVLTILTEFPEGLSSEMYSARCGCSPIIAREQLIIGEELGELCRDDSPKGLLYFPNRFLLS